MLPNILPASISTLLITLVLNILHLPDICEGGGGWLPLKSDVPMGHTMVEFRIKKFQPQSDRRTNIGSFRLPTSISPIHYDLEIRPILDPPENGENPEDRFMAPGIVTIHIKCLKPTSTIILHAKWLEINFMKIKIANLGKAVPVRVTGFNQDEDDERHFYTIYLDRDLTVKGEYKLSIPFKAIVADPKYRQTGLYRGTYLGADGQEKILAATQFQKAYAREAFPCFDEPSSLFKATLSMKIGRKLNYTSFSNMEKLGEPEPIPDLPGWVWDTYARTVKLPIYSIALGLASDYVAEVSPQDEPRVALQTWVPKRELTNTSVKFSAGASAHVLKFYEDLFDFPFPSSKLENFAIPMNDWGMENYGLITYRPNLLIWHDEENTQFEKWSSAWLVAHEFVHQWFGNIVTCEWWNDFWLHEGFARYFQYVGAQVSGVDFRAADRFVIDVVQWAMILDEGPDSVPVHNTEMERVQYFPIQIEYDKAGALIRMMATFLTKETFFKALKLFIKRHQYGNVNQDDLFQAMTDQAKIDGTFTQYKVKEVMDTWTKLKGFPVIRVSRADHDTIYISQHRFVHHPSTHNIESGLWYIPIWYLTKSNPRFNENNTAPKFWMDKDVIITYFRVEDTDSWIVINPEARGYYRVIYDDHFTNLILAQLESDHTQFDLSTRSQLIDDFFRSADARYISISYALDITWYLPKEDDLIVWTTALSNFRKIYTRLIDTNVITPFRKYIVRIITPPLTRLGVKQPPNDSPSNIMLRGQLLDWACALKDKLCVDYALETFEEWMRNPEEKNPIPTDYQPQIYCAAVAATPNNRTVHDFLFQHYKRTNSTRQQKLVIKALTCDQTEGFLRKLLEKSIDVNDKELDFKTDGKMLVQNLLSSSVGRNVAWNFLKERHERVTEIYGPTSVSWAISSLVPFASSEGLSKLAIEITSFISRYIKKGGHFTEVLKSLQDSAHKVVENSYWMEYFFLDIKEWFMLNGNRTERLTKIMRVDD